jgi:SAM-dependent methyltransferase
MTLNPSRPARLVRHAAGALRDGLGEARFDALVADIFGYNAVQLGAPEFDFLRANRMPFRFTGRQRRVQVETDYTALPFAAASLDLVVLPHVLEFASNPHQVLREVERVLVPEGQVVIAGFNPLSLFGLRRRLAGEATATRGTGNTCRCGA